MKRIVSGIQSTGDLTLGNYIGAIKSFVELQNQGNELFIFIADLHSLTTGIKPENFKQNRENVFALFLASGLDPEKTTIFYQSDVPEHLQMAWIMTCLTNMGELERMTQFKDKMFNLKKQKNGSISSPTGLFVYPSLMAADILLYNPDLVPTGADQKQHIELTQKLAVRLNNHLNLNVKIPSTFIPKNGSKIYSLLDPTKKMSKSDTNKNASIFLLDDPDDAYNKILKAKTDGENKVYISDEKPGIKNLLTIYSAIKNVDINESEKIFINKNYKEFKEEVATVVKEFLINIQEKYNKFKPTISNISIEGAEKAIKIAKPFIRNIYDKIGLL